ncbi:CopM family metallochaperone [Paracoccus tibetensis]|uniref:DUF305 domain-containing protein n=1 Tax=Paracoccus tibetensis TaxID=336292 RepID=A0A1G5FPK8_9RHOB|nr:DUF305 domain-containing protein [Paracoccus tibetensis]SCY40518.1 protein of unknown function [Paracoccus tibetensis]
MTITRLAALGALAAAALALPASAQDAAFQLPPQCSMAEATAGAAHDTQMDHGAGHGSGHGAGQGTGHGVDHGAGAAAGMPDTAGRPEHVQENMARMAVTMPAMHEGMMHDDPDIAFACGMIAHHQGAIDMAEVLLEHGSDPRMRALAEEIITAQVAEIEEMTTWLAERAD